MADWIISDDEANCIIKTAAKIIKNEQKEFVQSNATVSKTCYPLIDDVKIGWIPDRRHLFFSSLIRSELKVESSDAQICNFFHVICTYC